LSLGARCVNNPRIHWMAWSNVRHGYSRGSVCGHCDAVLVSTRAGAPGHHGVRGLPHLRASDPPRHTMALSMKALTFTPSHANSRHGYCRGHVTTSTRCPPCLVRSLHAPMRLHHSIDDGENGGGSPANGDGDAVWCASFGRCVSRCGPMERLCGHHASTCARAASACGPPNSSPSTAQTRRSLRLPAGIIAWDRRSAAPGGIAHSFRTPHHSPLGVAPLR